MAQVMAVPHAAHKLLIRQELGDLLGAGQSFFNSLFSPEPTTTTTPKAQSKSVEPQTTPTPQPQEAPPPPPNTEPVVSTPTAVPQTSPAVQTTQQPDTPAATTQPVQSTPTVQNTQAPAAITATSSSQDSGTSLTQLSSSTNSNGDLLDSSTSAEHNAAATSTALSGLTGSVPSPTSSTTPHKASSNAGLIAGVTIIILLILLSIAGLAFFYIRRRRKPAVAEHLPKDSSRSRSDSFSTISSNDLALSSIEKAETVSIPHFTATKASLVMAPAHARLREWSRSRSTENDIPQLADGNNSQAQLLLPQPSPRPRSKLGMKLDSLLPSSLVAGRRPVSGAAAAALAIAPSRFSGYEMWFQPLDRTHVSPAAQGDAEKRAPGETVVSAKKALTRKPVPVHLETEATG